MASAGVALGTGSAPPAALQAPGSLQAGVASVDLSWHLGASGGQFAATEPPLGPDFVDPYFHAIKKRPADALYSRIVSRALVVDDGRGGRVAIVGNDLYLPNDLLNRRVAELLEAHDRNVGLGLAPGPVSGIGAGNLAVTASHNHNSAFYSTPGWGTWIFQDVFDLRFFAYVAEGMARAVIDAAGELRPVRMAGATVPFNEIGGHTYGPQVATDGTPAGQPFSHTTGMVSVVRFDDLSDPARPRPYANWVTLGIHPEWTWGYDVVNGDITHAAMRVIDRELGTTTVMSQRETGTSGPHKDQRVHEPAARREFEDNGFENLDHGARLWADAVHRAYAAIDAGAATAPYDPDAPRRAGPPIALVPFTTDATVASTSVRVAPPTERPVPGVSNCNTSGLFHGHPQLPLLGLPDCDDTLAEVGVPIVEATPFDERDIYEQLLASGVPVPASYFVPSFTAVEETAAVHLMAMRLGDIVATFCPCEQFTDGALNIQTRLDRVDGNEWIGWDWTRHRTPSGRAWCVPGDGSTWTCANPQGPAEDLPPVSDLDYRRMLAQINNDAAGWETDAASLFGMAEPAAPEDVFGNFTHGEATDHGYGMAIAVGMANDYFGYVPEYREMRSHEHYRKALNGLGLHGADFLATRLVALAASLNGGPAYEPTPLDLVYQAESTRAATLTTALGELAAADAVVWEAAAYVDGGRPAVLEQPADITRYAAAHLRFVGGSNYVDLPDVAVERLVDGAWQPYATSEGEVQVQLRFPTLAELPSVLAGAFVWEWTAAFEAFGSDVVLPDALGVPRITTPPGTYRFVVGGHHRAAPLTTAPYGLTSEPFDVRPWDGVTIESAVDDGGAVRLTFGPAGRYADEASGHTHVIGPVDYPDSYASPFGVLGGSRQLFRYDTGTVADDQWYCAFCRFRPWADTGAVVAATVTVERADGRVEMVVARPDGAGGWVAPVVLGPGDAAHVAPGAVVTEHGDVNGARFDISAVAASEAAPTAPGTSTGGGLLASTGTTLAEPWLLVALIAVVVRRAGRRAA